MKLSVEHTAKVKTIAVKLLISSVGNEFKCLLDLLRHGSASLGILEINQLHEDISFILFVSF